MKKKFFEYFIFTFLKIFMKTYFCREGFETILQHRFNVVDILLINGRGTKLIEKPYLAKGEGTPWSIFIRRGRGSCVQNLDRGYVFALFLHIFFCLLIYLFPIQSNNKMSWSILSLTNIIKQS